MAQESSELDNTENSNEKSDTGVTNLTDNASRSAGDNQTNAAVDTSDDPEEIRQHIEETRASMSETIDAIGEKLSFANISEQVKEQVSEQVDNVIETVKENVYDATVGKAESLMKNAGGAMRKAGDVMKQTGRDISKTQLFKTAQANPLPLALIGLGVGLLIFGKQKGSNNSAYFANGGNKRRSGNQGGQQQSQTSALSSAQQKIGGAVSGAAGTISDTASSFYESAGNVGNKAVSQYKSLAQDNQLVIGVIAAAIGAVVAMAIPSTEYENELLGETKQNLMQKAQDSVGDLTGRVKNFVSEAGQQISDQVKEQVAAK